MAVAIGLVADGKRAVMGSYEYGSKKTSST